MNIKSTMPLPAVSAQAVAQRKTNEPLVARNIQVNSGRKKQNRTRNILPYHGPKDYFHIKPGSSTSSIRVNSMVPDTTHNVPSLTSTTVSDCSIRHHPWPLLFHQNGAFLISARGLFEILCACVFFCMMSSIPASFRGVQLVIAESATFTSSSALNRLRNRSVRRGWTLKASASLRQ